MRSRSPTHKSHPDSGGGEIDQREVVGVVFLEASGDCSGMLEFVEEALDEVAVAVEPWAERGEVDAVRHRLDVRPSAASRHLDVQGIAVIGTVSEQDLALAHAVEHVGGAASVVRLSCAQL